MRLIYPADSFKPKVVDELYANEFATAQSSGLAVSIYNLENFQSGDFNPRPAIENGENVLFRSWMLTADEYSHLHAAVVGAGGRPVTDVAAYASCHHLPNWYPLLQEFTAETRVYSEAADIVADLKTEGWDGCFLKDFVKSLSTDGGSLVKDLAAIPSVIAKMKKYRGRIEGGLCARRIENYEPASERRYFVWRGTAHSNEGQVPDIVREAAKRIPSPFFTVDLARRLDGELRIIELGDGQVSDRKEWSSHHLMSVIASDET